MSGFTKLDRGIVLSTVWREPNHVRIVWITMLALVDNAVGYVGASVPGLADAARVTLEECEDALRRFMSPDPYSRSKEHEGRRIAETDGGWIILNYPAYREGRDPEKRREQTREATARWRAKKQPVSHGEPSVSRREPRRAQAEAEAEAEAEGRADSASRGSAVPKPSKKAAAPEQVEPSPEPPDHRVTELRDCYVEAYRAAKGVAPLLDRRQWPRAMRSFKDLLGATGDLEAAKGVIRRALEDEWHRANRCQPWEIVADANKHVGTKRRNGAGPVQPNHGYDFSKFEVSE